MAAVFTCCCQHPAVHGNVELTCLYDASLNFFILFLEHPLQVHADTLPDAMYPVLADSAATQVDAAGQHLFPMYMEAACVEAACTDMH